MRRTLASPGGAVKMMLVLTCLLLLLPVPPALPADTKAPVGKTQTPKPQPPATPVSATAAPKPAAPKATVAPASASKVVAPKTAAPGTPASKAAVSQPPASKGTAAKASAPKQVDLSDEQITLNRAQDVWKGGDPHEALDICYRVIADSPDSAEVIDASRKIGEIYLSMGKREQALEEAVRTRFYQDAYRPSEAQKVADENFKRAATYCYGEKMKEAWALLEKVAKTYPGGLQEARTLNRMACGYYHMKDYGKAIPVYEKVLIKFPDSKQSLRALRWQGYMHYLRREYDQAIEAETRVVEAYRDAVDGLSSQLAGKSPGTLSYLRVLDKFVSYQQQAVLARVLLGQCYEYKNDHRQALATYRGLLAEYPDLPIREKLVMEVGRSQYFLGDYAAARETFAGLAQECGGSKLGEQAGRNVADIDVMLKKRRQ